MPQAFLHSLVQNAAVSYPRQLQSVGYILINAHRERVGLLENHAHLPAQTNGIQGRGSHVHPINADGASRNARLRNTVIHPVDTAQQRGLPEGPMNAVTLFLGTFMVTLNRDCLLP